ncbi:hypothetical protein GG804_12730 [Sphingomonas histidinilytica]|uniref:Catalytic LigB subunit of aromatic ring-opening dioxygenase n=2 Tax=Rhizorhabdus histidinilytica TaxID=439228 RepID=A0A1T4ZSW0_9SPHN|nr:hypothetical protein [Rhizorhabdus histidinilytica]MBO9377636.1 hypothetical protein [Rhizorhabdus histidinilytica]SKB25746.1 Catalytic LigB subunit of aromatic ring-opening dioxygenase [Rhizorhabdus histidinilytica]
MPIVMGAAVSHSPLLYRERSAWNAVSAILRKDAIQPKSAAAEGADMLDGYADRVTRGLSAIQQAIARADLDAIILLSADRGTQFDSSHVPQIHLQVGGELWGDPAIAELGEPSRRLSFSGESEAASMIIEELVRDGFDIAEARDQFDPVGDPARGLTPAAVEAVDRLADGLPIIAISINCHVAPVIGGGRVHCFGLALERAARLTGKRLGLLVAGGLSGDPEGRMGGWIDDVFDKWVLTRLERGRSIDLARVWDARSRTLLGSTAEVRLWAAAGAALEQAGCRATVHDYLAIHAAAAGIAFTTWEN